MAYDAKRDWWWEAYFGETPIDKGLDKFRAAYKPGWDSWQEQNPGGLVPYFPDAGDLLPESPYTYVGRAGDKVISAAKKAAEEMAKPAVDIAKVAAVAAVAIALIGVVYMAQKK